MQFTQKSFGGGLNTLASETQIGQDEYTWLVNGRNRYGYVSPVNKHVLLNTPAGNNYQGGYGLGNLLLIFIDGKAYYRDVQNPIEIYYEVSGFQMSRDVDEFYTEAVPASSLNYTRKLASSTDITAGVEIDPTTITGTPSALVVQDGINRAMLIFWDSTNNILTCRQSRNYTEWSITEPEYVPIGLNMMFLDGILYIVAKDRKSVYRSITGRPLDFMVNVDDGGDKADTEVEGGADTVSFAFDFEDITCLSPTTIPGSFIYGTANTLRVITVDYNSTIFGEPTFSVSSLINAGIVNWKCLVDILGDYAFIDKEAVVSFDAVKQLRFNGKNSIFSLEISKFLKDIKQTDCLAFSHDNYAFFNIRTTVGDIIAVYDILKQKWSGFDLTEIKNIKQVAYVDTEDSSLIFAITRQNKVYQLYGDTDNVYTTQVYTRAHTEEDTMAEHKSTFFRTFFNNVYENGSAIVTEFVDNRRSNVINQPIAGTSSGVEYPVRPPIIPSNKVATENPAYSLKNGLTGKKIQFVIQWDTPAQLIEYSYTSQSKTGLTSQKRSDNVMKGTYAPNS